MISSSGQTVKISTGLEIKQTVGQQSVIGSAQNKDFVVMQGFQQSLWSRYIAENKAAIVQGITVVAYPNPFVETINFQFSKPVADEISIMIFDILGRLIYDQKRRIDDTILSIDLARLPTAEFLVRLSTNNLNYYTKIIKQ